MFTNNRIIYRVILFILLDSTILKCLGSTVDLVIDERKNELHKVTSLNLFIFTCLLCLTIFTLWAFKHKRRLGCLHESGLAVIYGLIIGMIIRFAQSPTKISHLMVHPVNHFDKALVIEAPKDSFDSYNWSRTNAKEVSAEDIPNALIIAFNISMEKPKPNGFAEPTMTTKRQTPVRNIKMFSYLLQDEYEQKEHDESEVQVEATFNSEIFFYFLLPPIIFNAGYGMKRKAFFSNIGAILVFAIIGTLISVASVTAVLYFFTSFIPSPPYFRVLDLMYFGAIISATDPVTVLTIFQDLQADITLNAIVLGEALINDAVAVVLVAALEEYDRLILFEGERLEAEFVIYAIVKFFAVFFAAFGFGSMIGILNALLTKFTQLKEFPLLETSLFILMSFSSYLLAEAFSCSGIVAILFCGIFQAHYTFHNLSKESQVRTKQFFEILNFLSENFIFSYLGVSMFTFMKHRFNFIFIFGSFVGIAAGRLLCVYPLSALLNLGRKNKISFNFQHLLWFAGLRGAMAFALSIRNTVSEIRQIFFTTTCLITIATVIFNGGMTVPVLSLLKIPIGVNDEEKDSYHDMSASTESQPSVFSRDPKGKRGRTVSISVRGNDCEKQDTGTSMSWISGTWNTFDNMFMRPLLTSTKPTLVETMPDCFTPVSRLFTSHEQMDLTLSRNSSPDDDAEENEVFDLTYHEAGSNSMVCSSPSKPLLTANNKLPDYNGGFSS